LIDRESKSFEPNSRLYSDVHKHGYKKEMFAFWVCIGLTYKNEVTWLP